MSPFEQNKITKRRGAFRGRDDGVLLSLPPCKRGGPGRNRAQLHFIGKCSVRVDARWSLDLLHGATAARAARCNSPARH